MKGNPISPFLNFVETGDKRKAINQLIPVVFISVLFRITSLASWNNPDIRRIYPSIFLVSYSYTCTLNVKVGLI